MPMTDLVPPVPLASPPDIPPRTPGVAELGRLETARIIETIRALGDRVRERFPDRGIARVAQHQLAIAGQTEAQLEWVRRPILWVRGAVGAVILLVATVVVGIGARVNLVASEEGMRLTEMLQATESAVNEVILLGAAILFLATVETRIKRQKALGALRQLRALAHIVDMHQLTKDPDRVIGEERAPTPSSPAATMTRLELARYLDYCSEMLSLNSKLAALYAQTLHDPVVLAAVDEVETLTTGLCAKIWQKLVILNDHRV
jgi:hypothetical protein